jgi:hypothetical protein
MTVFTTAGSTIAISAGVPATFDSAGYAALAYTLIGEVTDFGEFGRKFNLVTHNPISSRGTQKFKGSFNEGAMTLGLGLDTDDAGQDLAYTASGSDAKYAIKVTAQNGDAYYFQALVMDFVRRFGSVDQITGASITLEITTSPSGVGVVIVEA